MRVELWSVTNVERPELFALNLPIANNRGHWVPTDSDVANFDSLKFQAIYGRFPTRGEIGCSLAHLASYVYLAANACDALLVLEHDAQAEPNVIELETIIKEMEPLKQKPWVLMLDSPRSLKRSVGLSLLPRSRRYRTTIPFGTTSYLISRPAAKEILQEHALNSTKAYWQADWPPLAANKITFFALQEPIFVHQRGESSIMRPAASRRKALGRLFALLAASNLDLMAKLIILRSVHIREFRFSLQSWFLDKRSQCSVTNLLKKGEVG